MLEPISIRSRVAASILPLGIFLSGTVCFAQGRTGHSKTGHGRPGSGAPRIERVIPDPARGVVGDAGLGSLTIVFSEPVTVPPRAVKIWTESGGPIDGVGSLY